MPAAIAARCACLLLAVWLSCCDVELKQPWGDSPSHAKRAYRTHEEPTWLAPHQVGAPSPISAAARTSGQEQVPQDEAHGGCCDEFVSGLDRRLPVNFGLLDRCLLIM
ncbi:uncharacterized protein LOC100275975 precursor [Zea mays]|uniref:Secreted protein n=1 Tax=Zea mays TaxID=4577 RepID=B6T270_MAIZE|nr:uncharacterized protein LOC100275975 precursor [Zea mays]ACG31203.1 hypothetical protein [Zea mays]|eukprot:NP_001143352.1 uncharacterized protein LOC100275975 precursor [Zea mays]